METFYYKLKIYTPQGMDYMYDSYFADNTELHMYKDGYPLSKGERYKVYVNAFNKAYGVIHFNKIIQIFDTKAQAEQYIANEIKTDTTAKKELRIAEVNGDYERKLEMKNRY